MESIIVDTGIIYTIIDKTDDWHKSATDFLSKFNGILIIPSLVVIEACYLLAVCLGQEVELAFINSIIKKELKKGSMIFVIIYP